MIAFILFVDWNSVNNKNDHLKLRVHYTIERKPITAFKTIDNWLNGFFVQQFK